MLFYTEYKWRIKYVITEHGYASAQIIALSQIQSKMLSMYVSREKAFHKSIITQTIEVKKKTEAKVILSLYSSLTNI